MAPRERRWPTADGPSVHPVLDSLAAYSWRLIGIGVVAVAVLWLLGQLWVVMLALGVAVLFSRVLEPFATRLKRHGWPPGLAAITVMLGFGLVGAGLIAALVPAVATEFEDLGPTLEQANDDLEDWLVEDSPFDVSRQDVQDFRDEAGQRIDQALSESGGWVVDTTLVVFEVITALVLATFTAFFMLKDGDRFGTWMLSLVPAGRRSLVTRLSRRAWETLGGYLRGAASLGVVEGTIIGLTMWIAGGSLALPVGVITFIAAFVPFVGAIVAGVVAVLVALVTGGIGTAIAVAVVAVLVQQLDNDLLAPLIYGRSLHLHPLVVLFAITAGGTLMGVAGAAFAVPVTAVVLNVIAEARQASAEAGDELEADEAAGEAATNEAAADEATTDEVDEEASSASS